MKKKVIVAMSGGVDSSTAAALLLERGYEVIGITLNVWPSNRSELSSTRTCCSITDIDDARYACNKLGIPHYVLNMRDIFKCHVIDYFFDEYMKGRTPNPCIACNAHVKFEALMKKAEQIGVDYVATGHYARIIETQEGELALQVSEDSQKDQTYVLYMLQQHQLSKLLFPCGEYKKSEIRAIAQRYNLANSHKPDSQNLCFVGQEGYERFIEKNLTPLTHHGNVVRKNNILDNTTAYIILLLVNISILVNIQAKNFLLQELMPQQLQSMLEKTLICSVAEYSWISFLVLSKAG